MDRNHQPDHLTDLEDRLRSIAPRDVSDAAMENYDEIIDELVMASASVGNTKAVIIEQQPATQASPRSWIWQSAAAITLGVVSWLTGLWDYDENGSSQVVSHSPVIPAADIGQESNFTLLKSVNRVDGHESDGLIIPNDGSVPHYRHRYHIVDEEQMRDEQSGTVITIRQPRREVITVPVTNF